MSVKLKNGKRGRSILENADAAVAQALDDVAKAGLLTLAADETLDVLSVTSTHYASWAEVGGVLKPVRFFDKETSQETEQFKSDYTVSFGRRYRGIPIVGSSLNVRMDSDGKMVAFMKHWRDIQGAAAGTITIAAKAKIDKRKNPDLTNKFRVKQTECGFIEDGVVGVDQRSPGVGCRYVYETGAKGLSSTQNEIVSIADNDSLALHGQPVVY